MSAELSFYKLKFPRDVPAESVEAGVLALAGLSRTGRQPGHLFSVSASAGSLSHYLGLAQQLARPAMAQLKAALPGLQLEAVDAPASPRYVWQLWLSTGRRPLNGARSEIVSRALLVALNQQVGEKETLSLTWRLGPVRRPRSVGSKHAPLLSESWGRALIGAAFYAPGELDADARKALREKIAVAGWRAVGFLSVTAASRVRAQQLAGPVLAALRTVEGAGAHVGVKRSSPHTLAATPWRWNLQLSTTELPGLLAWPLEQAGQGLPVAQRAARLLPASGSMATSGRLLGQTPLEHAPVYFDRSAALQHWHVLGPTGTGKSTLLVHAILQDIKSGASVIALDPKGGLVTEILERYPKQYVNELVVLDPADAAPVGFNPLAAPAHPELIADQLLGIFSRLYADSFGPRTADVLHAGLLTLARSPGSSLATLPLLLTHAGYRRKLLSKIHDPLGLGPFWAWFEALSDAERQQVIAPSLNKIRPFLLRPSLRSVIGQGAPKFDLSDLFTKRRVLLVNLAKGSLGPEGSSLLGTVLLNQLWQTALTRAGTPPERLRPVYLYADEVQDFLRLPQDLGDLLAQARSLKLGFTLAHQHLGQLPKELASAVLSNARSRTLFQLTAPDAGVFARGQHLLTPEDLTSLPAYEVYLQLAHAGAVSPYFSATTLPPRPVSANPAELRALSRERYGVPATETEQQLRDLVSGGSGTATGSVGSRPRRAS